jgi:uncharacterized protein (DUF4415 family)
MAKSMTKQIKGIQGVLGNYVTCNANDPTYNTTESFPPASLPTSKVIPASSSDERATAYPARKPTRLGRPPGKPQQPRLPKEKVTLRIDAELISDYRDWSWEKRCQLGELVEHALADYRRRRR